MGRSPCCYKKGLNRGTWSKQEDMILSGYIRSHGDGGWTNIPKKAGLKRCGKSCRLRWLNYLRPDIKRGNISPDEEELIIRLHRLLGNRWSLIAGRLPGRTDNEIKSYWNTHLSKKLLSTKESQPKSTQYLKTSSKSPALKNSVLKSTPVKITRAVRYTEMARPNGSHGYGCGNASSDEAFRLCTVTTNANHSRSLCDLLVNDIAFTEDNSESIAFVGATNLVEITEARNSICSMSSLVNERSRNSDNFKADAATLAERPLYVNEGSSSDCNLLSSCSDRSKDFGSGELFGGPSPLAAKASEFEILSSDRSKLRCAKSFTVPDDKGIEEFYGNTQDVDWIDEFNYMLNSSLPSLSLLQLESDEERL